MRVVVAGFEGGDSGTGSRFYWQKQENMSSLFLWLMDRNDIRNENNSHSLWVPVGIYIQRAWNQIWGPVFMKKDPLWCPFEQGCSHWYGWQGRPVWGSGVCQIHTVLLGKRHLVLSKILFEFQHQEKVSCHQFRKAQWGYNAQFRFPWHQIVIEMWNVRTSVEFYWFILTLRMALIFCLILASIFLKEGKIRRYSISPEGP